MHPHLPKTRATVPPPTPSAEIQAQTAPSAERRAWSLADELVGGDAVAASRIYLALRSQGERLPSLININRELAAGLSHGT